MKCIDEMIKRIQDNASIYDDDYMIAHLELADKLCEICKDADAVWYLDKIAQTFCEILEKQQEVIEDLKCEIDSSNTGTGWRVMAPAEAQSNYLSATRNVAIAEKKEPVAIFDLPEGGKFESSSQVKEAFVAYLKSIRKNGKPLSHTTVYDYSSRINMLFTHFEREWKAGKLAGRLQIEEGKFIKDETYLNVYNNLELLEAFVIVKEKEIEIREREGRPLTAEEMESPLNIYKNLRNSIAALTKFAEFKDKVDKIVKARGEM